MPLTKIEHEQIATAIQQMEARDPGHTGVFDFVSKSNILFLITRYTQEFYEENQEEDGSETHGGTD